MDDLSQQWAERAQVEAHLFPASDLDDPPRGGFAQYILRHGVRIFEPR